MATVALLPRGGTGQQVCAATVCPKERDHLMEKLNMALRTSIGCGFWLVLLGVGTNHAFADGWADKLFDNTSHDFGYVARGERLQKAFTITNKLDRRLHIASATPSCSVCTLAKREKDWIEPGELTELIAELNTLGINGFKSVTITVTFDQPFYGQAQLIIRCFSRSDIVINPGEAALGTVKKGTAAVRTITIDYAGDPNWKITSATSTNPAVEVELKETRRQGARYPDGRVAYVMQVRLKPDAPPGPIRDRILLGINDAYNKSIDLALQANVQSDVSLSPPTLSFGSVSSGRNTSKQVLVHGVRPFRILEIEGSDGPFKIRKPNEAKQLHVLTVELQDAQGTGTLSQDFKIKTDMEGEELLKLSVSANVIRR